MDKSQRPFLVGLYEEYLEEASFLYEHRLNLIGNPELTWKDFGELEARFEPFIDGLVVGGELALEICRERARDGDFGELHAAISVFCRQDRKDLVEAVLESFDGEDFEKVRAVRDALKNEAPEHWIDEFKEYLTSSEPKLLAIAAHILGYRRIHATGELIRLLERNVSSSVTDVIWALGRIGDPRGCSPLLDYMHNSSDSVRREAAVALLRLGDTRALGVLSEEFGVSTWPAIPLAMAGGRAAANLLLANDSRSADRIFALGILGDPAAIPLLIAATENPEVAATAASALQLVTGANLCEEAFVADELDDNEQFDAERQEGKRRQQPLRPDGKPYGTRIRRLSQQSCQWTAWWQENALPFFSGRRYRWGRPYTPEALLATLKDEATPFASRQSVYEELVIRYGLNCQFEADMLVDRQVEALTEMSTWCSKAEVRFKNDGWYFASERV